MLCAIWYHLYNLKIVKYAHGGVLLSVKLQAEELSEKLKVVVMEEVFPFGKN